MNLAFSTLAPVAMLVLLGVALRTWHFLPPAFFAQLNRFVFWIALPAVLFAKTACASLATGPAARATAAILLANLAIAAVAAAIALAMRLPLPTLRSFVQGAFWGNYSYVGLPVIFFAIPDESSHPAILLALAGISIGTNIGAVLLLTPYEREAGAEGRWRILRAASRAFAAVARNPLVVSSALGVCAAALRAKAGVEIPASLDRALKALGDMSMGGALVALGGSLETRRLRGVLGLSAMSSLLRLVACPLLCLAAARLLGLTGDLLVAVVLFAAAPAAVSSYVMADQMDADRTLSGAIVVLSTIAALPTMAAALALSAG